MIIVSIAAALLAFLFIFLSFQVIGVRKARRVAIGTSNDPELERAVRVQANFAEYVPFALVLLALCAWRGLPDWLLGLLAGALVIGRVLHAYGMSQTVEDFRFRTAGMLATFGVLGLSALSLIVLAVR